MTSEAGSAGSGFPRQARLTHPREYQKVFSGAKRLGDRYFTVLALANALAHPRLGLAVSRRNAPRAVDRNRIKRVVRESFRHHQSELESVDLVVVAKPAARDADPQQLFQALDQQWRRLRRR